MTRLAGLGLLMIAACGDMPPRLPPDAAILPGSALPQMLRQCSRAAPPSGEATWQPGPNDVAAIEAALPAALRARREIRVEHYSGEPLWDRFPYGWRRQYAGIVRGGRRYVYGNFFSRSPSSPFVEDIWRRQPVRVCDGGPYFFGVEYDVEARRFTHLAFNGAL